MICAVGKISELQNIGGNSQKLYNNWMSPSYLGDIAQDEGSSVSQINIEYKIWNRFRPNNLNVSEELLGTTSRFQYKNRVVDIKFPELSDHKECDSDAKITSWRKSSVVGGELKPSFYVVQCLYVLVDEGRSVPLNEIVTKTNANCYKYIEIWMQKQLNKTAQSGECVAEEFFDLLARSARWVTDDPCVCRAEIVMQDSGWGPRLLNKADDKTIWIGGDRILKIGGETIITPESWKKISDILSNDNGTPIFIDLFNDARFHFSCGDIKRCISDLAVSSEIFIRQIVTNSLPNNLASVYVDIIDNYNIRPILTKVLPIILTKDKKSKLKKLNSNLNKLFDYRNDLFHSAILHNITLEKCEKLIKSVRELIEIKEIIS